MVKLIVAIKRRPGISVDAFHDHWRTTHAELVRSIDATRRYVRRYVQCHAVAEEYEDGEPAFDGTAELWFDSITDRDAFFSDPEYLAKVNPDEARLADMERTVFVVTEEEQVVSEEPA